jgi:hypothetical protein
MSNLVELKTRPAEINASVIARLEEVLAEAREGKIAAVAIAGVYSDGSTAQVWSQTDDFGKLLGAVARLEYRINFHQATE